MVQRARNISHLVKKKTRESANDTSSATTPAPEAREVSHLPAHLLSPEELYRRERARRAASRTENDPLAAAREAYLTLLREEAASGKGGRPRKNAANAAPAPTMSATDEHEIVAEPEPEEIEAIADEVEVEEEEAPTAPRKRPAAKKAAPKSRRPAARPAPRPAARPASRSAARPAARPAAKKAAAKGKKARRR